MIEMYDLANEYDKHQDLLEKSSMVMGECPCPRCGGESEVLHQINLDPRLTTHSIQCKKCEYHSARCGTVELARRSWENSYYRKKVKA